MTDIRKRYRSLMMKVHPDHVGADPERQAEAHRLSQEANSAYEYLLRNAA